MLFPDLDWPAPPAHLPLPDDVIHVWRIFLDQPDEVIQRLAQTLALDERERAARFYFDRDRRRYIAGRGILRHLLGQYLGAPPERLQFRYGPHGKPALAEDFGEGRLHFNLSNSHQLALCAFAYDQELGIDLEHVHPLDDMDGVARHFFSAREVDRLFSLPAQQRIDAFFNCWTRKEAYLKACGSGLAKPLDQFDVTLAPGESPQMLSIEGSAEEAAKWFMQALPPGRGYIGALTFEGPGRPMYRFHCDYR